MPIKTAKLHAPQPDCHDVQATVTVVETPVR
jgi:hypothetical protein